MKKLLTLICALMATTATLFAQSSGPCGISVEYKLSVGSLNISGTGAMWDFGSVEQIPWFSSRSMIVNLSVDDGVTHIGDKAFTNSNNLSRVTIGKSVESIGEQAFYNCIGLTEITCDAENPPTCGNKAFYGVPKNILVRVPANRDGAYSSAPGWSEFTNIQAEGAAPEIADGMLTVYAGEKTNDKFPIFGLYMDNYCRSQYIIPAADLADMKGQTVYGLRYYSQKTEAHAYTSTVEVYLKEVGYTEFDPIVFAKTAAADRVYTGKLELVINKETSKAEMTVTFDNPFTYGGGNLLIGFDNAVTGGFQSCSFYGTEVTQIAGVYGYNSGSLDAIEATAKQFIPKTTFFLSDIAEAENQEKAQAVIDLIEAIGSPITLKSEAAIIAARKAYNALTDAQKALVSNYDKLTEAEATLAALKDLPAPYDLKATIDEETVTLSWEGTFDSYDIRLAEKPRTILYSFGFDEDSEGWTSIDADGDGYEWNILTSVDGYTTHNGSSGCVASASYDNSSSTALTPDNWLVSPQITLGGIMTLWATGQDNADFAEHFAVYVSTTGNDNPADFIEVLAETEITTSRDYKQYTVDLSAYSGKGYVAIRHFHCTNQYWLLIDDIEITEPIEWIFDSNDWTPKSAIINFAYLNPTTEYIFQVRGRKGEGATEWVETSFVTPLSQEDQAAVDDVIEKINAIGSPITLKSEAAIIAAREAYDALKPELQEHVSNYDVLQAAENALRNIPLITDGWIHYDNGECVNAASTGGDDRWGIRIPVLTVTGILSKVSMYVSTPGNYTVEIYAGEIPEDGTRLYTEVVNMPTDFEFNEVTLASPVAIDPTKDLWIVFHNTENYEYPITYCARTGVSNGNYLYIDGSWQHASEYSLDATWMIRAFIEDEAVLDAISKINDIGTVTYTPECKALIDAAREACNALSDVQLAQVTNLDVLEAAEQTYAELEAAAEAEARAKAKEALEALIKEGTDLKPFAEQYAPDFVMSIESLIGSAQFHIDDPGSTAEDLNNWANIMRMELDPIETTLLDKAKEQWIIAVKDLFLTTDDPAWYESVITPALNQVDAIVWDKDKTVEQNMTAGQAIIDNAKDALEALRAETRSIDSTPSDKEPCTKVLRDGHIFILRGEHVFDASGVLVK